MKNNSLVNFTINLEKILENNNSNKILFVSDRQNSNFVLSVKNVAKNLSINEGQILLIECVDEDGGCFGEFVKNNYNDNTNLQKLDNFDYIKLSSNVDFSDILSFEPNDFIENTKKYNYVFMVVKDLLSSDLAYSLNKIFDGVVLNISHENNTVTRVKKVLNKFDFLGMKVLGITISKKESLFDKLFKKNK